MSYYDNIRFHMESSENYTVQSGFDHTPSRRSSEIMVNSSSGISHESNDSVVNKYYFISIRNMNRR
jgi:hypothetical protein